ARENLIVKPYLLRVISANEIAAEEHLSSLAQPDHSWQKKSCAHISAGESDTRKEKSDLRGLGRDSQITSERNHRAGSGNSAIDGSNQRLFTPPESSKQ